jgi:predicted nicotinamide N-methyase
MDQPTGGLEQDEDRDHPTPALALFQAITAHQVSSAIHVAARLKIADHLGEKQHDYLNLAAATGTHPLALLRLLRLLVSAGLLTEDRNGQFALTAVGRHLRSDVPDSLFAMAMTLASPHGQERYHQLADSVETGKSQVEDKGSAVFTEAPPPVIAMLNQAMTFFAVYTARAIMTAADFSRFSRLVDVGAGPGMLLAEILGAHPQLHGVLFEQPHLMDMATEHIKAQGVADRCDIIEGDFFLSVPEGGDVYLLKHILHDWDDERCAAILTACHRAMLPGASLLVVETILPDRFDDSPASQLAARSDVMMLLNSPGGRERTEGEFRSLIAAAGFEVTKVAHVRPAWTGVQSTSVIEAVRREPGQGQQG